MNAEALKQTALVTVTGPCTCGATQWFRCEEACPSRDTVAEYDCVGFDGAEKVPHPRSVAYIESQHPGCWFRYIDLGAEFQRALESERARLKKQ